MFEKILVPLDGSELSEAALPYAEELMRRLSAQLLLLSICDSGETDARLKYLDRAVETIWRRARKYRERVPDAKIEDPWVNTVILEGSGNASEGIIDFVEHNKIDLTMMATHGRSGIGRWALGSVADRVARGVTRPVCLIRARGSQATVQPDCLVGRILAPLDGSAAGEAALPYVEALAQRVGAEVVLFQVITKGEDPNDINWIEIRKLEDRNARIYLRKVQGNLSSNDVVVRSEIEFGGSPADSIIEAAVRTKSAVVAMSTHGRSGISRWALGSVAEKVLRAGTIPLLLVRAPQGEDAGDNTQSSRGSYSRWSTTTESFV